MSLTHSFSGKRVLITGGGSGIGRQLVQRFHDDGAIVFTVDKNEESVAALHDQFPNNNVTAVVVDLNDWDATRKVVESFGVIDHLVNNAGIIIMENFLEVTKESCETQFNVNLFAIINISQVVAKRLIAEGQTGTIVNICSMTTKYGWPEGTVYGATKSGVENLTKSMAIELGQHGVRVNAISPGMVNTPIRQALGGTEAEHKQSLMSRMIVKRMIEPNEIADLVMFLSSPLSTMIIGENVVIDGGYLLT